MAIRVQYWENQKPEHYIEGPFVMNQTTSLGSGWRVEVERKNHKCSILPDVTIYELLNKKFGKESFIIKWEQTIEEYVNWLNDQYKIGNIIQDEFGNYITKD